MLTLPGHSRYAYSPIVKRPDYSWPGGKRLAFYVALNIEHFAFGAGLGMDELHRPQASKIFSGNAGEDRHLLQLSGKTGRFDLLYSRT